MAASGGEPGGLGRRQGAAQDETERDREEHDGRRHEQSGRDADGVAERVGIVRTVILTELATACGILAVALSPLTMSLGVLLPLGVALNGTSSALYATVADLVAPERRARAYGLYYTLVVGASAVAPLAYGVLGDAVGIVATLLVTSAVVLLTVPLCLVLRGALAPAAGARLPA